MGGVLSISEDLLWMPAGWVFDFTLEQILERSQDGSVKDLIGRELKTGSRYLDLSPLPRDSMMQLAKLLRQLKSDLKTGVITLHDPNFTEGYDRQLVNLLELIET